MKDTIGEWHDWQELSAIAKEITDHAGCKLLQKIDRTVHAKFGEALDRANQLRREYLENKRQKSASAKKQVAQVSPGILSASALAA